MIRVDFLRVDMSNIERLPNAINIDDEIIKKEYIKEFVKDNNNYCFVGMVEDKVVCILYGYGMLRIDGKSMFYIHSVDVFNVYQGQGIGTELINFTINYIKDEQKYYKFFVLADVDNVRANNLYKKYATATNQILFSKEIIRNV